MKILFLDQSGKLGGAELSLFDVASSYRDRCLVVLFADGSFKTLLEQHQIPVQVVTTQAIDVRKDSSFLQGLISIGQLFPLITSIVKLSQDYDVIYANTQKALVVGAIVSLISRRPLIYHLRDIVSLDHFSSTNRRIIVTLANRFASLVIANSQATQAAFVEAGGRQKLTEVVYNGFRAEQYQRDADARAQLRSALGLDNHFVVGHFSRLSPWKGQHILIEALQYCPEDVTVLLVGDALFGETDYINQLHHQIAELGLNARVQFLGFRSDIAQLMTACDLVAHTSTAPEPFGRVIVEAMFCGTPVVAAAAGGAIELVEQGQTGWLCPPNDPQKLAEIIMTCRDQPEYAAAIVDQAQAQSSQRFNLTATNQQIAQLLDRITKMTAKPSASSF